MNSVVSFTKEQILAIIHQLAEMHLLDEHETVIEDDYIFIQLCDNEFLRNKDTNEWTQII